MARPNALTTEDNWRKICENPTTFSVSDMPWRQDLSEADTIEHDTIRVKYLIRVFPTLRFVPNFPPSTPSQTPFQPNSIDAIVLPNTLQRIHFSTIHTFSLGPVSFQSGKCARSLYEAGCRIQYHQQLNLLIGKAMADWDIADVPMTTFVRVAKEELRTFYSQWADHFCQDHSAIDYFLIPKRPNMWQWQYELISYMMTHEFPLPPGRDHETHYRCLAVSTWGTHLTAMMEMTNHFATIVAKQAKNLGNRTLLTGIHATELLVADHLGDELLNEDPVI